MAIPDRLNELFEAVDDLKKSNEFLQAENITLKATVKRLEERLTVLENPNSDSLMTQFLRQN